MSDNAAKLRAAWSKPAFQSMIRGFWQTRVANGLTTPEQADEHTKDQLDLLDTWYPDEQTGA